MENEFEISNSDLKKLAQACFKKQSEIERFAAYVLLAQSVPPKVILNLIQQIDDLEGQIDALKHDGNKAKSSR